MGIIESIILGVVQGIAEFLPISSSAHLIVLSKAMGGKALPLALNVALHLGTVLAVLAYFWRDWWFLFRGIFVDPLAKGQRNREAENLALNIVVGSIPAGLIGLTLKEQIETYLHNPLVICGPLAIVGILLFWFDKKSKGKASYNDLTWKTAILIGVAQAFALIPGVSRSGSTILGGLWSGLSRESAAKYSFLLGTPAMLGAFALEMGQVLELLAQPIFFIGVLTSFLTGCAAIGLFFKYLRRFGLGIFAIYRTLLALGIFFWFSI